MKKQILVAFLLLFSINLIGQSGKISPDNTSEAMSELQLMREEIVLSPKQDWTEQIERMMELGLWKIAKDSIESYSFHTKSRWLRAELAYLNHEYAEAEKYLNFYDTLIHLVLTPDVKAKSQLLHVKLEIQSWDLYSAKKRLESVLEGEEGRSEALFWKGKIALLEKNYSTASEIASEIQQEKPESEFGYLLEAEVCLWKRQIDLARVLLKQSLERNPYSADARFWYGYAIWRTRDASQLKDMASQWKIALEINPLHYLTHWHWGNGHTHLEYADYVHESDEKALGVLQKMDSFMVKREIKKGLGFGYRIRKKYPESRFPTLFLASHFYNLAEIDKVNLDSSLHYFQETLHITPNFGGAHNGIAAVIKKKQFSYLSDNEQIEITLSEISIPEKWQSVFREVFPDMVQYPSNRVEKMVWSQLFASKAYLPMLNELERKFVIPPLHVDLATAMHEPWFKTGVVFDNRQWMDIRGVGSGATGIEYVERGAHFERNVTLHEFAHLFHFTVLTDSETRRIRQLYFEAMRDGKTIDYYSANNEAEYFAQAYTAYFSKKRIHPQNHKSMNTATNLEQKNPEMYAFVDSLVQKSKRFLSGEESVLNDNWAQTFVAKAQEEINKEVTSIDGNFSTINLRKVERYLKKALSYAPDYLPAKLEMIQLVAEDRLSIAIDLLDQFIVQYPSYAPAYLIRSELIQEQFERGVFKEKVAIVLIERNLKKAYELEIDWQLKYENHFGLMYFYKKNSMIVESVESAESYADLISNFGFIPDLATTRENAIAYSNWQRGKMGETEKSLKALSELVAKYPTNIDFRQKYAEVLTANQNPKLAIETLEEGLRFVKPNQEKEKQLLQVQLAENWLILHEEEKAEVILRKLNLGVDVNRFKKDVFRQIRVLAFVGEMEKAKEILNREKEGRGLFLSKSNFTKSEIAYAEAKILQAKGSPKEAVPFLERAVELNPYNMQARLDLIRQLKIDGNLDQARMISIGAKKLAIPPSGVMDDLFWELTK
jgi:Flp pilus assembly protein TadD